MDLNGFRTPQSPWFFSQPPEMLVETRTKAAAIPRKNTLPTQDNRFPGWAGPMADGRIATDYRAHCEVNVPAGMQFASKAFLQKNTEKLIAASRARQADAAGAGLPYDSITDLPPVATVKCDTVECRVTPAEPLGLGVERVEGVPPLFGTFRPSRPSYGKPAAPAGTTAYEGGRNTPRRF